jgi:hypothetical protein
VGLAAQRVRAGLRAARAPDASGSNAGGGERVVTGSGRRVPGSRSILGNVTRTRVVSGLLALIVVGCGSGGGARRSEPDAGPARVSRSTASGPVPAVPAQFTVADAERAAPPDAADARAIRILASDPAPTEAERAEMHDGMQHHPGPADDRRSDSTPAGGNDAELAVARAAAGRFPSVERATTAGYRLTSRSIPGIGAHYVDWSRVTEPFDAASPAMLLFDGNGPEAQLVGLSYLVRSPSRPTGFRRGGAVWHRHAGLCLVHGLLVGENVPDASACDGGRGDFLPGRDLWMLHVWVVPGHANPWGTFAAVNPKLCSPVRAC